MPVAVGQQAPDATLVSGDRKAVKISDLRGKATVLAFFPAAFTGTCTKEMCRFRDDLSRFNSLNANVVGISADTPFVLGGVRQAESAHVSDAERLQPRGDAGVRRVRRRLPRRPAEGDREALGVRARQERQGRLHVDRRHARQSPRTTRSRRRCSRRSSRGSGRTRRRERRGALPPRMPCACRVRCGSATRDERSLGDDAHGSHGAAERPRRPLARGPHGSGGHVLGVVSGRQPQRGARHHRDLPLGGAHAVQGHADARQGRVSRAS